MLKMKILNPKISINPEVSHPCIKESIFFLIQQTIFQGGGKAILTELLLLKVYLLTTTKTCVQLLPLRNHAYFKYIENFMTKKRKIFR